MCFVCVSQLYTDRTEKHLPPRSVAVEWQVQAVHGGQSFRLSLLQVHSLIQCKFSHIGKAARRQIVQVQSSWPCRNQRRAGGNIVDPRRNDGGRPLHRKSLSVGHIFN